jgi:hypothetical protein
LGLDDHSVQALLPEGAPLPGSPAMRLRPEQVKIYRDSKLVASQ